MPDLAPFDYLTAAEYLAVVGRRFSLEPTVVRRRAAELLALADLKSASVQAIVGYSCSMRRRLALSAALLHRPELLLLNDPFAGFDASCHATFEDVLPELRGPHVTLLLTSTSRSLLEGVCARIGILDRGRLVGEAAGADPSRSFASAALSSLRPE